MKYIIKTTKGYVVLLNAVGDIAFKDKSEATEFESKIIAQYFANKLVNSKLEEI